MNEQFAFVLADLNGRVAAVGLCLKFPQGPVSPNVDMIPFVVQFQRVAHVNAEAAAEFKAEWRTKPDLRHASLTAWRGCTVELFYPVWWKHSAKHFLMLALDDMFDDLEHGALIEPESVKA